MILLHHRAFVWAKELAINRWTDTVISTKVSKYTAPAETCEAAPADHAASCALEEPFCRIMAASKNVHSLA